MCKSEEKFSRTLRTPEGSLWVRTTTQRIGGKHSDRTFHRQPVLPHFKSQMHYSSRAASCEAAWLQLGSGCEQAGSSPVGPLFSSWPSGTMGQCPCRGGHRHPSPVETPGLLLPNTLAQRFRVQGPLP